MLASLMGRLSSSSEHMTGPSSYPFNSVFAPGENEQRRRWRDAARQVIACNHRELALVVKSSQLRHTAQALAIFLWKRAAAIRTESFSVARFRRSRKRWVGSSGG